MAICAAKAHCTRCVHGGAVDGIVAAGTHAAARLSVGFFLRLENQKLRSSALRPLGDAFGLIGR